VAGVVCGVERSDGEEQCACGAAGVAVWFGETASETDGRVCYVFLQDGETALLSACLSGQLEVARWLVSAGSNAASERDYVRTMLYRGRCAAVCDDDALRAGWQHCTPSSVLEWALGGRTVAGVVCGFECSDGEGLCAYDAVGERDHNSFLSC
jgi:hypothetical protein